MFKRLSTAVMVLFVLTISLMALQDNASTQETRSISYIVEVIDKVSKFHPNGPEFSRDQYIDGARTLAIAYLNKAKVAEPAKSQLIKFLKGHKFKSVTQLVHVLDRFSNTIAKLDMVKLSDILANGVVRTTSDPFSQVLTMEQIQKMQQMMQPGQDKSIGAMPQKDPDGKFKVSFIRWGYPAYYMGMRVGDELVSVNGKKLADVLTNDELTELLNAEQGAQIKAVIVRKGYEKPITLVGVQRNLDHPDCVGVMIQKPADSSVANWPKIGYIRTDMFTTSLHTNVEKIIKGFLEDGMQGLILDLRNNPGGAINSATGLADMFLPKDAIITIMKSKYDNPLGKLAEMLNPGMSGTKVDEDTTHFLAQRDYPYRFPLVVLINELSASASEMLSGCLKSHERATVIGVTSYGKGIGQTAIPLSASPEAGAGGGGMMGMMGGGKGMRMLYMTVMTYFGPKMEKVHHIGIVPNIKIVEKQYDEKVFDKVAKLRANGLLYKLIESADMNALLDLMARGNVTIKDFPNCDELRKVAAQFGLSEETMVRETLWATYELTRTTERKGLYILSMDNQFQTALKTICEKIK